MSTPSLQRSPAWIEARVTPEPNTGCWLWMGWLDRNGYGRPGLSKNKSVFAHRLSWEAHVGPIPKGLVIDHKCRVRSCVNPDHLRVVTVGENTRCGHGPTGRHLRATHCVNGHPFDDANTHVETRTGWRRCRTCNRDSHRRSYAEQVGVL